MTLDHTLSSGGALRSVKTVVVEPPDLLEQMLAQHGKPPTVKTPTAVDRLATVQIDWDLCDLANVALGRDSRAEQKTKQVADVKRVADAMADLRDIFPPSKWDTVKPKPKRSSDAELKNLFSGRADPGRGVCVCGAPWCPVGPFTRRR